MPRQKLGSGNHWLTCITIEPAEFGATREDVRLSLEAHNIEARPVWKPLHMQPVFAGCRVRGGERSAAIFERGLCLPSGQIRRSRPRAGLQSHCCGAENRCRSPVMIRALTRSVIIFVLRRPGCASSL